MPASERSAPFSRSLVFPPLKISGRHAVQLGVVLYVTRRSRVLTVSRCGGCASVCSGQVAGWVWVSVDMGCKRVLNTLFKIEQRDLKSDV